MNFGSAELELLLDKEHILMKKASPDFASLSKVMTQPNADEKEAS